MPPASRRARPRPVPLVRDPDQERPSRPSVKVTAVTPLVTPTLLNAPAREGGCMKKANVNGVVLEYEERGNGEPLLLISPVLADGFVPLVSEQALAAHYRLILYHKRGWAGSSRTPPGSVSVADHARDAVA